MWGIPWIVVQRMLIDAPSYESDKSEKPKGSTGNAKLDHDTLAASLMARMNSIQR
jgi:hypothetical protein